MNSFLDHNQPQIPQPRPPAGSCPKPEDTPRTRQLKELRQKRLMFYEKTDAVAASHGDIHQTDDDNSNAGNSGAQPSVYQIVPARQNHAVNGLSNVEKNVTKGEQTPPLQKRLLYRPSCSNSMQQISPVNEASKNNSQVTNNVITRNEKNSIVGNGIHTMHTQNLGSSLNRMAFYSQNSDERQNSFNHHRVNGMINNEMISLFQGHKEQNGETNSSRHQMEQSQESLFELENKSDLNLNGTDNDLIAAETLPNQSINQQIQLAKVVVPKLNLNDLKNESSYSLKQDEAPIRVESLDDDVEEEEETLDSARFHLPYSGVIEGPILSARSERSATSSLAGDGFPNHTLNNNSPKFAVVTSDYFKNIQNLNFSLEKNSAEAFPSVQSSFAIIDAQFDGVESDKPLTAHKSSDSFDPNALQHLLGEERYWRLMSNFRDSEEYEEYNGNEDYDGYYVIQPADRVSLDQTDVAGWWGIDSDEDDEEEDDYISHLSLQTHRPAQNGFPDDAVKTNISNGHVCHTDLKPTERNYVQNVTSASVKCAFSADEIYQQAEELSHRDLNSSFSSVNEEREDSNRESPFAGLAQFSAEGNGNPDTFDFSHYAVNGGTACQMSTGKPLYPDLESFSRSLFLDDNNFVPQETIKMMHTQSIDNRQMDESVSNKISTPEHMAQGEEENTSNGKITLENLDQSGSESHLKFILLPATPVPNQSSSSPRAYTKTMDTTDESFKHKHPAAMKESSTIVAEQNDKDQVYALQLDNQISKTPKLPAQSLSGKNGTKVVIPNKTLRSSASFQRHGNRSLKESNVLLLSNKTDDSENSQSFSTLQNSKVSKYLKEQLSLRMQQLDNSQTDSRTSVVSSMDSVKLTGPVSVWDKKNAPSSLPKHLQDQLTLRLSGSVETLDGNKPADVGKNNLRISFESLDLRDSYELENPPSKPLSALPRALQAELNLELEGSIKGGSRSASPVSQKSDIEIFEREDFLETSRSRAEIRENLDVPALPMLSNENSGREEKKENPSVQPDNQEQQIRDRLQHQAQQLENEQYQEPVHAFQNLMQRNHLPDFIPEDSVNNEQGEILIHHPDSENAVGPERVKVQEPLPEMLKNENSSRKSQNEKNGISNNSNRTVCFKRVEVEAPLPQMLKNENTLRESPSEKNNRSNNYNMEVIPDDREGRNGAEQNPEVEIIIDDDVGEDDEEEPENVYQEFLERLITDPRFRRNKPDRPQSAGLPSISKSQIRPRSAGNTRPQSASKVKTYISSAPYKRHWERSSIAWSSYNPGELNTRSSVKGKGQGKSSASSQLSKQLKKGRCTEDTYVKYLAMSPRIHQGDFSIWLCLPDEVLLQIFSYLSHRDLARCAQTCSQFCRITQDVTLWRRIKLKHTSRVCDRWLSEIGKHKPAKLSLIQCDGDQVTATGLRELFRQCADSLQELNITACNKGQLTGDNIILHAASRCRSITHLDLSWSNVSDNGVAAISENSERLEAVTLNGCQAITDEAVFQLTKAHGQNLHTLELFGCFNLTSNAAVCINDNCKTLTTLNLGQCWKLSEDCLNELTAGMTQIKHLDLRGCKQIKDTSVHHILRNCPQLKSISLANCSNLTDVTLLEISTYSPKIKSLDMCGCKNITDEGVRSLTRSCKNLSYLDFSSTAVTYKTVSAIANYCNQQLEVIKLNFCKSISEKCLVKLAKHCTRLKKIYLYGITTVRNTDCIKMHNRSLQIEM